MVGATQIGPTELTAAIPQLSGELQLKGLSNKVEVYRDDLGIPYVRAENEPDAFLSQGFVTAQDRLWQMEYDRLRGSGRWAEAAGDAALEQDKLMRRFRLTASAKADYAAMDAHTKQVFDAYAAGVNAFIQGPDPLPAEYAIAGIQPEPWQPRDSLIVYKVRHILMGVFESKVWRARMVRAMGPEKAGRLFPGYEPGHLLILPPGATAPGPLDEGLKELAEGAAALNYLSEMDAGSNSWVLAGDSTATGKPLLAGDSHRALDTPNAYYQNRIACPEFDVIGLSFPGVPAFPHFGHNPWVCWSVTHTAADYQDLYIERLRGTDQPQYLHKGQWRNAQVHHETIRSNTGRTESFPVIVTNHGPIISNTPPNPTQEWAAMSLKYTATQIPPQDEESAKSIPSQDDSTANAIPPQDDEAAKAIHSQDDEAAKAIPSQNGGDTGGNWPAILWRMLRARNADELAESQRGWVDPCNNFLFADIDGNIGYLCRGRIPIRPRLNGWLPVPGWSGEYEWQGDIPFDQLPRSVNPTEGYIATANNRPVGDQYPHYIAVDFTPEFRVKSVTHGLMSLTKPAAPDMAKVHAQRVSLPSLAYLAALPQVEPQDALSAIALQRLLDWDGSMDAHRTEPAIYSAMRDALLKELLERNLPPDLAEAAWHPADRGLGSFSNRFKARMIETLRQNNPSLLTTTHNLPNANNPSPIANVNNPSPIANADNRSTIADGNNHPTIADGNNHPTIADGNNRSTIADSNNRPTLTDSNNRPTLADSNNRPTLADGDNPSPLADADNRSTLADGDNWPAAISRALARGVANLRELLGDDPDDWAWGRIHRAIPHHTLSASRPELSGLLDPPPIPASGDGDTPLAGGYSPSAPAAITSLSVARYCYDTANWDNSLWIVPLGSSGHPASPHYHDQSEPWRQVQMRPMRWHWPAIKTARQTRQTLNPA